MIKFSSDVCDMNCECEWLIQCPTRTVNNLGILSKVDDQSVLLTFSSFQTENGFDTVTLHDGRNSSSPMLTGPISGVGPYAAISSRTSSMLVRYTSDSSLSISNAFAANFSCGRDRHIVDVTVTLNPSDQLGPSPSDLYQQLVDIVHNRAAKFIRTHIYRNFCTRHLPLVTIQPTTI